MDTTPCVVVDYGATRLAIRCYMDELGWRGAARHLWRLWRDGFCEWPPEHYCFEHAKEHGFCWGCGQFWAGCEDFDFSPSRFCSNCKDDFYDGYDEYLDDEEWLDDWADYPAEMLASELAAGAGPARLEGE